MFVQAVWAPYGPSIVYFQDLISLAMTSRVSSFRIDGDLMSLAQHIRREFENMAWILKIFRGKYIPKLRFSTKLRFFFQNWDFFPKLRFFSKIEIFTKIEIIIKIEISNKIEIFTTIKIFTKTLRFSSKLRFSQNIEIFNKIEILTKREIFKKIEIFTNYFWMFDEKYEILPTFSTTNWPKKLIFLYFLHSTTTSHLKELHTESLQLCRDVTASMGLLMLKNGLYQAHQKLVQRTAAAISDARSIHKGIIKIKIIFSSRFW